MPSSWPFSAARMMLLCVMMREREKNGIARSATDAGGGRGARSCFFTGGRLVRGGPTHSLPAMEARAMSHNQYGGSYVGYCAAASACGGPDVAAALRRPPVALRGAARRPPASRRDVVGRVPARGAAAGGASRSPDAGGRGWRAGRRGRRSAALRGRAEHAPSRGRRLRAVPRRRRAPATPRGGRAARSTAFASPPPWRAAWCAR